MAELKEEIQRVHREHHLVYGAGKVWTQMNREGIAVSNSFLVVTDYPRA